MWSLWLNSARATGSNRRRCHQHLVCAQPSFAHPTGIEPTTSCLQTAEAQIPRKIRPDVVLTCGTLGQTRVPIEYRLRAKTRRFAGTSSDGANRDRTGDLLLAKQALSQLSYGPANTQYTPYRADSRAGAGAGGDCGAALESSPLPIRCPNTITLNPRQARPLLGLTRPLCLHNASVHLMDDGLEMSISLTALLAAAQPVPDLRFFQAAATIIPLLLLAIVFQARTVEHIDPTDHPVPRLLWICMLALIALMAGGTTLQVLANGHATRAAAQSVAVCIVFLAGAVVLGPLLVELKRLQEVVGARYPVIVWGLGLWTIAVGLFAWRATVFIA